MNDSQRRSDSTTSSLSTQNETATATSGESDRTFVKRTVGKIVQTWKGFSSKVAQSWNWYFKTCPLCKRPRRRCVNQLCVHCESRKRFCHSCAKKINFAQMYGSY